MSIRIGTTSFIYPGSWLYNVERLGPHFDDVEILFFESQGPGAFPPPHECEALARCKREHGLSYSLHTPLDASLASESARRRSEGVRSVLTAIDAAAAFTPETYVLHVYWGDAEHDPRRPADADAWRARATESLSSVIAQGVAPEQLCIELLDYDFGLIEPVIEQLGLSVALDVGHLVRDGQDELAALERLWPRTRLIQWHGTDPSDRDHRSLEHYPRDRARALLERLSAGGYTGVLTIEVFREADLASSRSLLEALLLELTPASASGLVSAS